MKSGTTEAPSNMHERVQKLSRRIGPICAAFYDRATDAQKEELWVMLEDLEATMLAYLQYDKAWDSKLIDVIENIQGIKVKAKAFSSEDTVMDKARKMFVYVATSGN